MWTGKELMKFSKAVLRGFAYSVGQKAERFTQTENYWNQEKLRIAVPKYDTRKIEKGVEPSMFFVWNMHFENMKWI